MNIYVGYWSDNHKPQSFINKPNVLAAKIVAYLMKGKPINDTKGWAECRICGVELGTCCRTSDGYVWPDKLEHYVNEHQLWLPEFDFMLRCQ